MCKSAIAFCTLATLSFGTTAQDFKVSGYYKNLLTHSETVIPAGDRYMLDLNRMRVELKGKFAESVAVDFQYDNEILIGDYVRTGQFALQNELQPNQYSRYASSGSWYGRHRLYRGNVTFSAGDTDLRLGRQRIAWGTGRFWSPLDLLNPFNPIALEREERSGLDAVLAEYKSGPLSRFSAVYAPKQESVASSAAVHWHSNAGGVDYSLVAGRIRGERVAGADIATQWAGAGIRAEVTHSHPGTGRPYRRAVLAADYAFPNTLTLSGELYFNGAGTDDVAAYDFVGLFAGRIQNVGRRYFGGYVGYEITPLIKTSNYLVVNLGDHSRYFSPAVVVSLATNVDLTLGVQHFRGPPGSEYARFNDVYYAQLQWFY